MHTSPFHIYYKARQLAGYVNGENKLLATFASSNIKIYPYQVAASLFALQIHHIPELGQYIRKPKPGGVLFIGQFQR